MTVSLTRKARSGGFLFPARIQFATFFSSQRMVLPLALLAIASMAGLLCGLGLAEDSRVVLSSSGAPLAASQSADAQGAAATATTTITLSASPSKAAAGSLFTLVASVKTATGSAATAGSVTFYDGAAILGAVQVVTHGAAVGTATWKTLFLPLGANSITAKYAGLKTTCCSAPATVTSAAATVDVTGAYPSGATLVSTGQQGSYSLTAIVSGNGPATPTGSVVFKDTQTGTQLGTAAVSSGTLIRSFPSIGASNAGTTNPSIAAIADVNGDGKPDLIVGAASSVAFSVLLGNGDGSYQAAQTVAGTPGAQSLAVADFNGDGIPDVAIANGTSVAIFLGKGDGTFQPEADYGSGIRALAIGDFNGDGILDIVAGTSITAVDILEGNGDGTFKAPAEIAATYSGAAIVVGDFNGDGKPDVLFSSGYDNSNSVTVVLGYGNGTFEAPIVSPTVNYFPYRFAIADLNGDGKLDLVTNDNGAYIGVMLGNGDGTFQAEQTVLPYGNYGQQAVADVNGDGKPDLIAPNLASNTVAVYYGNGDGTFQAGEIYGAGNGPVWVSVSDVNADGQPDLAVANYNDGSVSTLLNRVSQTARITGITLAGFGADAITGTYSGDANFAGATSGVLSLPSNVVAGSRKLTVTPASGVSGTLFTLTASALTSAGAPVSQGVFTFYDGSNALANVEIDSATAVATFLTRSLDIGAHSLKATLNGTGASPVAVSVTGKYPSSTSLSATGAQGSYSFSALVGGFGFGAPSGSVAFTDASSGTTLGSAALSSAADAWSYLSPIAAASPGQPDYLTIGDFNGDGRPDVAVTNYTANTVSVYLSNGDGTVQAPATYAVGVNPWGIVSVDLNNDGVLDLAVVNQGGNSLSVLLGDPNGTFQAQQSIATGNGPTWAAAGDFNGDGIADLAVANGADNTIDILLGTGKGTFQAPSTYRVGASPAFVAAGDFNGDKKLDLAIVNSGEGTIGVMLGTGDGTFQPQQKFLSGSNPLSAAIGDLNGDGVLDLAVANTGDSTLGVLIGNGDGTFQAQTTYAVDSSPYTVAIGDVNGDGKPDLASANGGSEEIGVLLGNGNGTFLAQQVFPAGNYVQQASLADVNGDGRLDIILTNPNNNALSIMLGAESQSVSLTGVTLPGTGTDNVLATYSGNTVFSGSASGALTLPSNPWKSTTTLQTSSTTAALGVSVTLTASVLGANGHAVTEGSVNFYRGGVPMASVPVLAATDGDGSVGTATLKTKALPSGTNAIYAEFTGTDIDSPSMSNTEYVTVSGLYATTTSLASTGELGNYTLTATLGGYAPFTPTGNVIFADATSNTTLGTVAVNSASRLVSMVPKPAAAVGTGPSLVVVADMNGDQIPDLVMANSSGKMIGLLIGNGDGTYAPALLFGAEYSGVNALAAGDFNGDGKLDIATADGTSVSIFLNTGKNNIYSPPEDYPSGSTSSSIAVGDFNHDGKLDVVVTNAGGSVSILLGNGDGTFLARQEYAAGNGPMSVVVSDFNGDGNLDLAVANEADGTIGILLGNGDGTFQAQQVFPAGLTPMGLAAADVNGDGIMDLATTNYASAAVTVLLGVGNGTFQAGSAFEVGNNPGAVAIGDVNRDGKPDLVVANSSDGTLSVLLGKGNGTFAAQTTIASDSPYSVAVADLNNDSNVDIVDANYYDNTASVFLNQGSETAVLSQPKLTGTGTHNVTATYSGDSKFQTSASNAVALAVSDPAPAIALTAEPAASVVYGQLVTVVAALTGPQGVSPPTGSISYAIDGGAALTAALIAGSATLNTGALSAGSHSLVVNYAGDSVYSAAGPKTLSIAVAPAPLSVIVNNATRPYGATNPTFTGAVTGLEYGGVVAVSYSTIATATSTPGTYPITAALSGTALSNYRPAITSGVLTVAKAASTTSIGTATTLAPSGSSVSFTAQVSVAAGTPAGTVTFTSGGATLGSAVLGASGKATFATATLPVGVDSVAAAYGGDSNFAPSTSSPATVKVATPPSITGLNRNYGANSAVVSITGTNFGATQGSSTITFNGTLAPSTSYLTISWTETRIAVAAPGAATTGNLVVTVGGLASNGIPFTIYPELAVTGISPVSGPVGTLVTITGTNMMDPQGNGWVDYNGVTIPFVSQSNTKIQVQVPSGATTGVFRVHACGAGYNSPAFTVN